MAKKTKSKIADVRKLSDADLRKEMDESYRQLFKLRLEKETLQLANHRQIPAVRHTIARLKTIQRQRELAQGKGSAQ